MAKISQDAVASPQEFPLSLDEFCSRVSKTDRRVELIGAFYADEIRAGRVKDTEVAFAERLRQFATQPA